MSSGPIALLIIGAAIFPLEPKLLGCKYGENLKVMSRLGDFDATYARPVGICRDDPDRTGDYLAYESFQTVCDRALRKAPEGSVCIAPPSNWVHPK